MEVRGPDTLLLNADVQTKWLKIILKDNSQLGNKQNLHLVHARSERPSRKGTKAKFKMKGKEKEVTITFLGNLATLFYSGISCVKFPRRTMRKKE